MRRFVTLINQSVFLINLFLKIIKNPNKSLTGLKNPGRDTIDWRFLGKLMQIKKIIGNLGCHSRYSSANNMCFIQKVIAHF